MRTRNCPRIAPFGMAGAGYFALLVSTSIFAIGQVSPLEDSSTSSTKTKPLAVPAISSSPGAMGMRFPVAELDLNRDVNAPMKIVPFEAKTAWNRLVEDTLVQHNGVLKGLRRQLSDTMNTPDRTYGGQFHSVVIAIGEFRDSESLPQLIQHFDLELDPATFPPFRCFPVHFPVAASIARIGGLAAANVIVSRAVEPMTVRQVFLSAWILQESLSKNRAHEYLRASLNNARSPLHVENLRRILEVMSSEVANVTLNGLNGERIDELMRTRFPEFDVPK